MSRMPNRQMSTSSTNTSYSQRAIPGLPGKQIKLAESSTHKYVDNNPNVSQVPNRKMSTSSRATSGSQHMVPGLPGKQVKVSHSDSYNHLPRQTSQPRVPSHTPIRGPSPRRNPNPLGISVNTQVTRHQGAAPTQVFPNAAPKTTDNDSGTNNLAPTATTPTHKKKRREAPTPLDLTKELSPNDREIPIIFSSSTLYTGSIRNLQTQHSAPGNSLDRQVIISPLSANTPQIIVTPVEGNVGQAYGSPTSLEPRMPRPPSSLYSRRTQGTRVRRAGSESQSVRFAKQSTFFASAPIKTSDDAPPSARSRRASEATVIDDDSEPESPAADEETPLTAGGKAKRGSLAAGSEGVPTPRRSNGWWNVVFPSPFFSRFSAAALSIRGLPTDQRDSIPEVPSRNLSSPTSGPRGLNANTDPPTDQPNNTTAGQDGITNLGAAAEYYDNNKNFETPPPPKTQTSAHEKPLSPDYSGNLPKLEKGHAVVDIDPVPTRQPLAKVISNNNPLGIAAQPQVARAPVTQQTSQALRVPPTLHQIQTTTTEHHYRTTHVDETKSPSPVIEMASVGVRYSRSAKSIIASRSSSASPDIPPQPPSKEARQTVFPGAFTPSASGDGPLSEKPLYKTTFSANTNTASFKTKKDHEKPSKGIGRSIFSRKTTRTTYDESKRPPSRKQKCLIASIAISLFIVLLLVIILAMTLVKDHSDMPVQVAWLNLTGYPPMQTGIATIAQPSSAHQESGCVQPKQLWSCDLSASEMQADNQTNAHQPNFRLEIRFKNDSALDPVTMQIQNHTTRLFHSRSPTVSASHIVRNALQKVRRDFSSVVFNTNPPPPGQEDQHFLGQTTDGNQARFEGEPTPFYISILPSVNLGSNTNSNATKRQLQSQPPGRQTFANLTSSIPDPSLASNGTAAPSNLYPFPESQMLMLYNRGRADEHYGFYTYFDRTLLMQIPAAFSANSSALQSNSTANTVIAAAVSLAEANAQCTWSQTRFKVAIWTNSSGSNGQSNTNGTSATETGAVSPRTTSQNNTSSSANDFTPPGSFALPVTITLDRHGGDPAQKAVYCYGLSEGGFVDTSQRLIWPEDRGFGGSLVAPAAGPFADNMKVRVEDGGMGGIDGGTGGCGCEWVNW